MGSNSSVHTVRAWLHLPETQYVRNLFVQIGMSHLQPSISGSCLPLSHVAPMNVQQRSLAAVGLQQTASACTNSPASAPTGIKIPYDVVHHVNTILGGLETTAGAPKATFSSGIFSFPSMSKKPAQTKPKLNIQQLFVQGSSLPSRLLATSDARLGQSLLTQEVRSPKGSPAELEVVPVPCQRQSQQAAEESFLSVAGEGNVLRNIAFSCFSLQQLLEALHQKVLQEGLQRKDIKRTTPSFLPHDSKDLTKALAEHEQ